MATAKFDESTPDNPKLIAAGPIAAWLWFCGVLYCRRTLTDGFIPTRKVPHLFTGLPSPFKHAARLVDVGLWLDAVGGYQVHDFLDHNPSKQAVDEWRRKDRERKQAKHGIRDPMASGIHSDLTDSTRIPVDEANAGGTHAGTKSESESESEEGVSGSKGSGESAREGPAPAWTQTPSRRTSALVGGHRGCFDLTPTACARGLCVPNWLGQQWRQQYGDDLAGAERAIRAVVAAALAALPPVGPIGDEPKKFWPAVWRAAHGSQAPHHDARAKGQLTLDAARRVAHARMARSGRAS